MIDLTRSTLPNTITVNGRAFSIYTDFRLWMKFEISLSEHRGEVIPIGYLFKNERPTYCNINALLAFSRPAHELPRAIRGTGSNAILIDFRIDSDLIYAAILQQYGIDLIDVPALHWHKFLSMLNGLKGTKLDEVMGYRCYEKQRSQKIDPYEELRDAWMIAPDEGEIDDETLEAFNEACSIKE